MLSLPVNTFDRQSDETEQAWAAFHRYRDLPQPRARLEDFAHDLGEQTGRVKTWFERYAWASRVLAWDQRVDRVRQDAVLITVEEMARRHVALANDGLDIVALAMAKMKADLSTDFGRLKAQEMARLLDVCAKLQRLSLGQATERVEGTDFSGLSDEELDFLAGIAAKTK